MADTAPKSFLRQFLADAAMALVGLAVVTGLLGATGPASAGSIAEFAAGGEGANASGLLLLGLIISSLLALNLAFYRHLKSAYTPKAGNE